MDPPRQQFCAECHSQLKDRLSDTKLGNASDFGTVHPEFRAWVVSNADTKQLAPVSLDANPKEDSGLTFSHQDHLNRFGGVAKMAMTLGSAQGYGKALGCADCHKPSSDGVRFEPVNMERDCEACHSLAYSRVGGTVLKLRHGDIPQMLAQLSLSGPVQSLGTTRDRPGDFGRANFASGGGQSRPISGSAVWPGKRWRPTASAANATSPKCMAASWVSAR